jgi:hypothetical protein
MAYADGCDEECSMPWQSRGNDLRVAWLPDLRSYDATPSPVTAGRTE